jgi:predicted ArsR family transcriptional regulator
MSLESDQPDRHRRRILDDPTVIRGLAHPLRLQLHALVGREGPITAADAARLLGVSQALASHHLRQLAKYGYVEPAPAADSRERPWQVTTTSMSWRGSEADPDTADASDLLEQLYAEQAVAGLLDWQRRRRDWDARWRDNSGIGQSLIYLTAQEMVELQQAYDALLAPLIERRRLGDATARPADARPVDITIIAVPLEPLPSGG